MNAPTEPATLQADPKRCPECRSDHVYIRLNGNVNNVWSDDLREARIPKHCTECGCDFVVRYQFASVAVLPPVKAGPPW